MTDLEYRKSKEFIFKQCDMNRLSINAKKDEKSPYPLENNELGMNLNFQIEGRYRADIKYSCNSKFVCDSYMNATYQKYRCSDIGTT